MHHHPERGFERDRLGGEVAAEHCAVVDDAQQDVEDEQVEALVVALPDAVPDPVAVVIVSVHAHVTLPSGEKGSRRGKTRRNHDEEIPKEWQQEPREEGKTRKEGVQAKASV